MSLTTPAPAALIAGVLLLWAPASAGAEPGSLPAAQQATSKPVTSVAMDVRRVSTADFRAYGLLELQRSLALRLLQAGFAVVAADKSPQLLLTLSVRGAELVLSAHAQAGALIHRVPRGAGGLDGFHLEVAHKAVELLRQAEGLLPTPAADRSVAAPTPPPPAPARPRRVEVDLGVAALLRLAEVDPLVRLGAGWGPPAGPRVRATFTLKPPTDAALDIIELSLQLGAAWRLALPARLRLDLGLLAGVLQHSYSLSGADPPSGTQWDFLGSVFVELGWQPLRNAGLAIWAAPGISEGSREHTLDGSVIWRRTAARVELGAGAVLAL